MAKPKLVAPTDGAPQESERQKIRNRENMAVRAMQAAFEIEALAQILSERDRDQKPDVFVYAARGIGRRIDKLSGILMCYINGGEFREDDVASFERDLYG